MTKREPPHHDESDERELAAALVAALNDPDAEDRADDEAEQAGRRLQAAFAAEEAAKPNVR